VAEIIIGKDHIELNPPTLSAVSAPARRLNDLEVGLGRIKANTIQRATLASHPTILKSLFAKETPETNNPAARLLAEAALKVVANGGGYFGKARPGEFWITLADEHGLLPVRIKAPEAAAKGKPLSLVIALHGAGGSENMFFDAYGNGKIVDLCRKRGWLLVAPRLSLFGLSMPVDSIVSEIERIYPVDKRQIFVAGHSMGAAQAINIMQRSGDPHRGGVG
jgi:pimeloyl-ACP methyl ester carboxylesterase